MLNVQLNNDFLSKLPLIILIIQQIESLTFPQLVFMKFFSCDHSSHFCAIEGMICNVIMCEYHNKAVKLYLNIIISVLKGFNSSVLQSRFVAQGHTACWKALQLTCDRWLLGGAVSS